MTLRAVPPACRALAGLSLLLAVTATAGRAGGPLAPDGSGAGQPTSERWELTDFLIYLWGRPPGDDFATAARTLADGGFTVVDATPEEVPMLRRHGLKAMVHRPDVATARRLRGNPGVWGYHLRDEPYPEDQFRPLAEQMAALGQSDPTHAGFINMLSTTGEFLRTYMQVVRPPLLSFDYYQWWWGSDRYFEKLEQFREAALLAGVPLAACFEVSANPAIERGDRTHLPDNLARLRQSVYTTLAYGAKGVEWFNAAALFEPDSAELSAAGRDVAAVNDELSRVGPILAGLRSLDVYHTAPFAAGTRSAPKEHWIQIIGEASAPGLVFGTFKDPGDVDYVLVANRDYRAGQHVVVRLQSKWLGIAPWHEPKSYSYGVEQLDRASGEWTTISSSSAVGFSFVIGPSDGELFRITTTIA